MKLQLKDSINGGKSLLTIYIGAAILSYIYIILTGEWNGDFTKREILIGFPLLTLVLFFTILPSLYCYWIFKYSLRKQERQYTKYNINLIRNITWFLFVAHMLILVSGYGVMGTEGTRLSLSPVALTRAVLLKFSPRLWGIIYILMSNNQKNILITCGLFVISSLLGHSLGGVFILLIIFVYKYRMILPFLKKHFILSISVIYLIPTIIIGAYNLRGQLRGFGNMQETSYSEIIFGKLCGRISSISNNGYLLESFPTLLMSSQEVPNLFYLYDPLHYLGIHPAFKSTGSYVDDKIKRTDNPNSSTMASPLGVLVISITKSPMVLLINLSFMLIIIPVLFKLLRRINFKNNAGVGLIIALGFAQNGDSSDIANNIYGIILMWIILSISHKKHVNN